MPETQNPDFGRKVFFLNPSYKTRKYIVSELRIQEYEVYEIDNYKTAKNILRHNPHSILFINSDSQMVLGAWVAFIKSFSDDAILKTIKTGILSERIDEQNAKMIFDMVDIEAGITSLSGEIEKVLEVIKSLLDMHGAKGRRRYVRCSCTGDKAAQLFWTQNIMHQFKILDISSVTLAVRIPNTLNFTLKEGHELTNTQVVLGKRVLTHNLTVYIIKDTPAGHIAILTYDSGTALSFKALIREFIAQTLHNKIIASINNEPEDTVDYTMLAKQDNIMLEFNKTRENSSKASEKKSAEKPSDDGETDGETKEETDSTTP